MERFLLIGRTYQRGFSFRYVSHKIEGIGELR